MVFLSLVNSQQSQDVTAKDLKIYPSHNFIFSTPEIL